MTDSVQVTIDEQVKIDLLMRIPVFAELPTVELKILAEALNRVFFPAGKILFREGEMGNCLTILIEGQVEVIQALGTPDEHILAVVDKPGDFLGEMSLFYQDGVRSASARAWADTHLLELKRADFDSLLLRRPNLAINLLQQLTIRLRNSEDTTIRDLQQKNIQLTQAYLELKAAQAQIIEQEKLEQDLRTARRIQESILPKEMPDVPGWRLSAYWNPAREVSGDFYDFVLFPDGKLAILIGDVTDKGLPAALVMATTRSVLRVVAKKRLSPGDVLREVNDLLYPDMPPNMFVTCLCAIIDPETGSMRFANAGHDLPYQLSPGGAVELRATGMPLGLMPGLSYDENETSLEVGDKLVLYSDGLVEAHNSRREMFGFPYLRALLSGIAPGIPPKGGRVPSLIEFLNEKLAEFTGPGWEQEDDVTMVVAERLSAAERVSPLSFPEAAGTGDGY